MKIRFKARALTHIEGIHEFIAAHDPRAASRVVHRIEHSISRLGLVPFSGRPGVVEGTRILVVPGLPYVVVYRVGQDTVDIVAILHTARRRRS
jgi:plasmid stabilization system protein ParE